jgi:hypothetical protein
VQAVQARLGAPGDPQDMRRLASGGFGSTKPVSGCVRSPVRPPCAIELNRLLGAHASLSRGELNVDATGDGGCEQSIAVGAELAVRTHIQVRAAAVEE